MTVTLKPWSVALLVATIAALGGFAVGQVTQAQSDAQVSRTTVVKDPALARQVKELNRTVKNAVGASYTRNSILGRLYTIQTNTGYVCREVSGSALCKTIP